MTDKLEDKDKLETFTPDNLLAGSGEIPIRAVTPLLFVTSDYSNDRHVAATEVNITLIAQQLDALQKLCIDAFAALGVVEAFYTTKPEWIDKLTVEEQSNFRHAMTVKEKLHKMQGDNPFSKDRYPH